MWAWHKYDVLVLRFQWTECEMVFLVFKIIILYFLVPDKLHLAQGLHLKTTFLAKTGTFTEMSINVHFPC